MLWAEILELESLESSLFSTCIESSYTKTRAVVHSVEVGPGGELDEKNYS
jgi:hypothetical protein